MSILPNRSHTTNPKMFLQNSDMFQSYRKKEEKKDNQSEFVEADLTADKLTEYNNEQGRKWMIRFLTFMIYLSLLSIFKEAIIQKKINGPVVGRIICLVYSILGRIFLIKVPAKARYFICVNTFFASLYTTEATI